VTDLVAVPTAPEPPPTTPARTRIAERVAALMEVVMCSGFPTQLFLLAVMSSLGMQLRLPDGGWSPLFVTTLSLLDTALVLALVVFFLRSRGERVRSVFLGVRPVGSEIALGFLLLPFIFVLAAIVLGILFTVAPELHNVPRNPLEDMLRNPRDTAVFALAAMIAGGLREEVQRGFILHRFRQSLGGGPFGVAVYSLFFGLGHLDQGYDAAIAVATLGAIWGSVYLVRGSIVAPMVSHAAFNLAQVIKFVVVR
jgi:membrane protease YdiL (CAAX protease family)